MDFSNLAIDFSRPLDAVMQSWLVKLVLSVALTLGNYLSGASWIWPFVLFWSLVLMDGVSKILSLSVQTLKNSGSQGGIVDGYRMAVNKGVISSQIAREKFVPKILFYFITVTGANIVSVIAKWAMPILGDIAFVPAGLAYVYLSWVEWQSICENGRDAGINCMGPLAIMASKKKNELLGNTDDGGKDNV
ncbi:hypothetical protein [Sporomusa malonica]|uniref:Holin n=1 Tax=Sporomusa malonica TaxID=112901 RepID=A0A1W2AQY5_9FIRM|nr:hypothetical protein [Sporomusa malonica]SMC63083.1 hypothetical protein SAMN04488500_10653 [Sporomusa malonica]